MASAAIHFRDEGMEAQGGETWPQPPSQGGDLGEGGSHLYRLIVSLDSTGDRPTEVWGWTERNVRVGVHPQGPTGLALTT